MIAPLVAACPGDEAGGPPVAAEHRSTGSAELRGAGSRDRSGHEVTPAAAPSPADSAAAEAADVSPEWVQRSGQMQRYEDCVASLEQLPAEVTPRLREACRRLPGAPR